MLQGSVNMHYMGVNAPTGMGNFGVNIWVCGRLKIIAKHRILGLSKRVSCAKRDGPILTTCMSYEVFLRKELPFGGRDRICVKIFGGANLN